MTDTKKSPRFVRSNIIIEYLTTLMLALTIISLVSYLLRHYDYVGFTTWNYLFLICPATIFLLIRRIRIGLPAMLVLHLLTAAGSFFGIYLFLSSCLPRRDLWIPIIILGAALVILMISSILHRFSKTPVQVKYDGFFFYTGIHLALFVFCRIQISSVETMFNAVLVAGLYFVARQLYTFNEQYYHNLHSSTQPAKAVRSQYNFVILILAAGILLALVTITFLPIQKLSNLLSRCLKRFVAFLFSLIDKEEYFVTKNDNDWEDVINDTPEEVGGGSPILDAIIEVIVVVCIVVLLVVVISRVIRAILNRYHMAEEPAKVKENTAVTDVIEDIEPDKIQKASHHDFGTGYEKEIRKKYYKTVTKAIRKGATVRKSASPKQIETIVKENGDPSITELTSLYESVRYSNDTPHG